MAKKGKATIQLGTLNVTDKFVLNRIKATPGITANALVLQSDKSVSPWRVSDPPGTADANKATSGLMRR